MNYYSNHGMNPSIKRPLNDQSSTTASSQHINISLDSIYHQNMDYNINNLNILAPTFHNYNTYFWLRLVILPALVILHANAISFNRTDFRNWSGIAFGGDANTYTTDGVGLRLNANKSDSTGRAVYAEEMQVWNSQTGNKTADFDTTFSFLMTMETSPPDRGDGFAFFLAKNGSHVPPNARGGCLGLISNCTNTTAVNGLVAVEFDNHKNDQYETSESHIAIDVNSIRSVKTVNLTSNWSSGSIGFARIWYTSQTKTLSVRVSYRQYETYELSHQIDLSQVLPEHLNFGFSASTGDRTATHDILSWEFSSTNFSLIAQDLPKEGGGVDRVLLVACVIGGSFLIFLGVALLCGFRYCKKRTRFDASNMDREFEHYMGPKKFSYKELVKATNKFAEEGKLGEGGFGEVYKGYLSYLNLTVAVKRGSKRSKQGRKEYMSEVKIISRLRHRNLVQLIGWCHEISKEFLLVYEFLPNGSLDSHLFGRKRRILSWEVRHKIVLGLASALLYLHEESERCVLHRDIKSSNIMLDSDFNAKLGDFGLARLVDEATGPQTTALAGTLGYMAPEYISTSKVSKASDVFSFGVVALEIACGRKSIERNSEEEDRVSLVAWVWAFYGSGRLLDVVDERLCMEFNVKQMECLLTVGLWCVHPDHNLRPSIKEVIQVLSFEAPLPDLPKNMPVPNYHAPENATIQVPLSTSVPTITYSSIFLGR
ncbi:L-type lectin-domain containing receptor kinase IX.1-like [Morus notabilis]|uniref:L-type lectin-domain containing receptor kinase IX.1-like n=1 Tax=Morus notabilis TaxID=981085 RepID=UPI000CED2B3B|nr:L-type lectin-domain containing receptor kinase IX.1-like [Morus notabilis]